MTLTFTYDLDFQSSASYDYDVHTHLQKFKVKGQLIPKTEWKNGRTDRQVEAIALPP